MVTASLDIAVDVDSAGDLFELVDIVVVIVGVVVSAIWMGVVLDGVGREVELTAGGGNCGLMPTTLHASTTFCVASSWSCSSHASSTQDFVFRKTSPLEQ